MYGTRGSWRNIYHYIWKKIDSDNEISFQELYENPYTQLMLADQFHNIGQDNTKNRFKEMFAEIKKNHCGIDDDCEEEEMVTESLVSRIHQEHRNQRAFNSSLNKIIASYPRKRKML